MLGPLAPSLSLTFGVRMVVGMLYLVAGALWALGMAIRGRIEIRSTGMEMPALLFFVLAAISTANAVSLRPALLQTLLWVSYAVGFLVVSHTAVRARHHLLFPVGLVVCGIVISFHGIYQGLFILPETRIALQENPVQVLEQIGLSLESFQELRGRVTANEVMGTFLLSTSLAGFLLIVLPIAIGLLMDQWRERRLALPTIHFVFGGLGIAAMLACLFMTGSKGGWLGFAVAMAAFVLRGQKWLRERLGKPLVVVGAALVICVVIAQQSGLLPPEEDDTS